MDIETLRKWFAERDTFSILETVDVHSGARTVLHEFDYVIEAPNWTADGRFLVYNANGRMYTYELATGDIQEIDTGFATDCNNDHVLSTSMLSERAVPPHQGSARKRRPLGFGLRGDRVR